MAIELIQIKDGNFPKTSTIDGTGLEYIVVSKSDGVTYGMLTSDFKAFLGTVQTIAPKAISPSDPAPTLDGLYFPLVDGTYTNLGGIVVDRAEGGVDFGMSVQIIKEGSEYIKYSEPFDIDTSNLTTKAEFETVEPVAGMLRDSPNLIYNSEIIAGSYLSNGSYSPNNNRITTARMPVDRTQAHVAYGIGFLSAATPRFHFWGVTNNFLGLLNSNGELSQVVQPANMPTGTVSVTVQIANVVDIGLDPTNSPFADTAVFKQGTDILEWRPAGKYLAIDSIGYPVRAEDERINEKIDSISYLSKNKVNMLTDAVDYGYLAGTGAAASSNANRLGTIRYLVDPLDIGKDFTVSGNGPVPATYAVISIRNESGDVLYEVLGNSLSTPTEHHFIMPADAFDIGFTIASEVNIGVTPLDNKYTKVFQYEEGSQATFPTIKGDTYVNGAKIVNLDIDTLPPVFVSFDPVGFEGRESITFYTRRGKTDIYVGHLVQHELDMSDLVYTDQYRIRRANDFRYIDGEMSQVSIDTIFGGESECVYQDVRGGKVDFTGGVHGDEIYSSIGLFIDGLPVSLTEAFELRECESAWYIQVSTMHETATSGGHIVGHPVNNNHYKKTVFTGDGYTTHNDLVFVASFPLFWYHGISCIGKVQAATAYDEEYQLEPMTGSLTDKFNKTGLREIEYYNTDNSKSAAVSSVLYSTSVDDLDCLLFVQDRASDSKYYRKTPEFTSTIGERYRSIMEVIYK